MKIFSWTLALLMAGLAFVAAPLIAFLPALFVGVLLISSPLIVGSLMREANDGGRASGGSQARGDQR